MNQVKIESLSVINKCTLLVFYTSDKCWQFRVISQDGSVFGESKIYYTSQAARETGISWIVDEN